MELLQKKLNGLLDKYQAPERAVFTGEAEIEIAGERTPLLPWRAERQRTAGRRSPTGRIGYASSSTLLFQVGNLSRLSV